jgi:hypothetical protein
MIDRELLNRIIEWKEELGNVIQPKGRLEEDISYLNQDIEAYPLKINHPRTHCSVFDIFIPIVAHIIFCVYFYRISPIIGDIGLKDKRVDELMLKWSVDEDFWVRRVAIDHQLGRKEKTNTDLLEKILTNNFGSKEFFINKAIGWALRDYSKTNPDWVRYFIGKYKNKMDKLSIREGSKYI